MSLEEFNERMRRPAEWVLEMRKYYQKYGSYRAQDLRRLLGHPCEGIEVSREGMRRRFLDVV